MGRYFTAWLRDNSCVARSRQGTGHRAPRHRPKRLSPLWVVGQALVFVSVAAADEPLQLGPVSVPVPVPEAAPAELAPPAAPPAAAGPETEGDCRHVLHPSGRLAAVVCGRANQPPYAGSHRLAQHTGTLTTYYEHGGVHELLSFRDGLLDGMVEVYDPVGHLIERAVFQRGTREDLGVLPRTAPIVPSEPTPSFDPTQPSEPDAPSAAAVPPPSPSPAAPSKADDELGVGLSLRVSSSVSRNAVGSFFQLGPSASVMVRAVPSLALELRAEFQHTVAGPADYRRIDVPLIFGMRWELGRRRVRPFLVLGLGPDYAWRKIPGDIVSQPSESAWLLDTQGGFGVIGKISKQVSWLGEVRLGGRFRVDDKPRLYATAESGAEVELLGNQFTAQLGLGFQWMP